MTSNPLKTRIIRYFGHDKSRNKITRRNKIIIIIEVVEQVNYFRHYTAVKAITTNRGRVAHFINQTFTLQALTYIALAASIIL